MRRFIFYFINLLNEMTVNDFYRYFNLFQKYMFVTNVIIQKQNDQYHVTHTKDNRRGSTTQPIKKNVKKKDLGRTRREKHEPTPKRKQFHNFVYFIFLIYKVLFHDFFWLIFNVETNL